MPHHCEEHRTGAFPFRCAFADRFPVPAMVPRMSCLVRRAQCIANLKLILKSLEDQELPLDDTNGDEIRIAIDRLNLECPEGTDLRGKPAAYRLQTRNGICTISEERGNHPTRAGIMAGRVAGEQFGIDAAGTLTRVL